MKKVVCGVTLMVLCAVLVLGPLVHEAKAEWEPKKPIKLIVPWGAGGSTDRSARTTVGVIEDALGQKVVVVNQPGASGSVGTKGALDAPRDGYTWTAGAAKDLGNYKVQGLLDTVIQDWHLFLNVAMPQVVSVNVDTPYQTFDDLLKAFKAGIAKLNIGTAVRQAYEQGLKVSEKQGLENVYRAVVELVTDELEIEGSAKVINPDSETA